MYIDSFLHWFRTVRRSSLVTVAATSMGAFAQVTPMPYQHCEVREPGLNSPHRIETNYRYSPSAALRTFQHYWFDRCEPAFAESAAIFDALGACQFRVVGCSTDSDGSCKDGPDDWIDYEFLRGTVMSDGFKQASLWSQNPNIKIHSGPRTAQQWGRHRWWGWSDPARYAYQGVVEEPMTSTSGPYPRCYGMAYLVGLFNGVWNTRKDAEASLDVIKADNFVGQQYRGAPVKHQLFYNQSGCNRSSVACLEDVAEVFIQRSAELDQLLERRWEFFWEQVTGQADTSQSFASLLRSRVLNGAQALVEWFDAYATAARATVKISSARMLANPPTSADAAMHMADLIADGKQGYRAVLVAHSQGNLFVNAAYDGYLAHAREGGSAIGEDTNYVAAKVVHVAPAATRLIGPHVLAEIDLVIDALRGVDGGPVAPSTLGREVMPPSLSEPSGHALVATYLDSQRRAREDIRQLIFQAMDAL